MAKRKPNPDADDQQPISNGLDDEELDAVLKELQEDVDDAREFVEEMQGILGDSATARADVLPRGQGPRIIICTTKDGAEEIMPPSVALINDEEGNTRVIVMGDIPVVKDTLRRLAEAKNNGGTLDDVLGPRVPRHETIEAAASLMDQTGHQRAAEAVRQIEQQIHKIAAGTIPPKQSMTDLLTLLADEDLAHELGFDSAAQFASAFQDHLYHTTGLDLEDVVRSTMEQED
jgi:hypothetical protein